jgi:ribonuclease-3
MTAELQERLGHRFSNPALLEAALIHSSFASENPKVVDNERLEFLGDAVLQLAVTDRLYERYGFLREGEMAKARATCVNKTTLAHIARKIGLGEYIRVGAGEQVSGGCEKSSILADAMEAVIAAVYLDSDYTTAASVILSHWEELVELRAKEPGKIDFKTRLQEMVAPDGMTPEYRMEMSGPDHARVFKARVLVGDEEWGSGEGPSKKAAQQAAARMALENRD